MGIGTEGNSLDRFGRMPAGVSVRSIKIRTALEAGSFGSRVLGMPGPVGTSGRENLHGRSTGSEAGGAQSWGESLYGGGRRHHLKKGDKNMFY